MTQPVASPTPIQRRFDDLGEPLIDVTFCVVDLETTGGSSNDCGITEIGAVKLRGGECLGTFQTLVNPGMIIPPDITILTGITQAMVMPAPRIDELLPTFLEFLGDAVVVGHNVRFDLAFLNAALHRSGRGRLTNRQVDTLGLARRLVRDEVPNCRLGTLADRLRLPHRPSHRALDDALATGDLLHLLLERAGRLGVTGLDDLIALPKLAGHPQAKKLSLTDDLPRHPGVYLFHDDAGRVLYVGKAANLRQRVRSYFSGDQRRKVSQLLRETHRIDHVRTANRLEAAVVEVRLIHQHQPRFNSQIKQWQAYTYLKLTAERFPRLSITKVARDDGALYIGPLASARVARLVAEAIESAVPIRRYTARPGQTLRDAMCAPAQLGVATCPCSGAITEADYAALVRQVVQGVTTDQAILLDPLDAKMRALASDDRYEEAAAVRDRAAALEAALLRRRRVDQLRSTGRISVDTTSGAGAELHHGLLVRAWGPDAPADQATLPGIIGPPVTETVNLDLPPARDRIDELLCVALWLDDHRGTLNAPDESTPVALAPLVPKFKIGTRR